jgi:hypothetical protein
MLNMPEYYVTSFNDHAPPAPAVMDHNLADYDRLYAEDFVGECAS